MSKKREKWARFGMFSKGFVYAIIGALTALAAFNLGGSRSGNNSVLEFLADQPFGKVLLAAMAVGLFGYTFYRLYQSFYGDEEAWSEGKGFVKRSAYIISAIFYALLGVAAIRVIWKGSLGSGGESIVQILMSKSYGPYLLGVVALGLLGKGVFQFYKAISGKFRENVQESGLKSTEKKLLIRAGYVGFIARGIISSLLAYLLFKVCLGSRNNVDGKTAAFDFLQNNFGAAIMGIVALGLLAYGVFMFLHAKHATLKM
ncbi:MAG: DUF1206 domain-containing protein [Flavobacteriales bacterium]|jgi:hypothetical protein|uniref:DUF1206 domain-containing protein n=1 Tax=Candidatus Ulvibacter alkanivorans TaxID=2267620 RepID=UPI000DF3EF8F|nr:DUF1206 domain-containing protein [Candidatus Ulvibacter alkanivorans]MCH2490418.1 DUF1206 domain-containing protein [Flavobacteriales bacterium]